MKRKIKDAFRNVSIASQHQWLPGFMCKNNFYKETCLSFRLATAAFIFNLFNEGLHPLLVSFSRWVLCHYLDDFIVIFDAVTTEDQICRVEQAYIWITDLLGIVVG